ncbi:MAG: glycosyltransferase family 2 protein, partial [Acidimicrobiales bacterium]
AALLILAAAGVAGPARLLLALAFITFVPGWALLGHLPLAHGVARLALVVALSLTICTALAQALLWLRWWNPGAMLAVLAAASVTARILVRHHRRVVGSVTAVPDDHTGDLPLPFVDRRPSSAAHQPAMNGERIAVVLCTRDRDEYLATSLKLLRLLEYGWFEVVVVDNAPSSTATRDCFMRMAGDDLRFRYVVEPVPGLSRARNRGMVATDARYVAFTDDDTRVDARWLDGLAAGFARAPEVGCVTGLVTPAELDTAAQRYFDRRFSWASRVDPRMFSLDDRQGLSRLYPYSAGLFGTGANFAVDRRLFQGLGGFDVALGAGTPAGGGEDLDAFVRILRAGYALAYEPSAVVWHYHRRDNRALRRQLFRYGAGLTAFLAKYASDRQTTGDIVARLPPGVRQIVTLWSPTTLGTRPPAGMVLAEVAGMAAGPLAYAVGRQRTRAGGTAR